MLTNRLTTLEDTENTDIAFGEAGDRLWKANRQWRSGFKRLFKLYLRLAWNLSVLTPSASMASSTDKSIVWPYTPLSPVIANFYMEDFEKAALDSGQTVLTT
jgi:hypothetical protein